MDRYIQWGELEGGNSGFILGGQIGQSDVGSVAKGEAVILVLEVYAGAKSGRVLVNKAENSAVGATARVKVEFYSRG